MNEGYAPKIPSIEETKKLIDACYYREMAAIKGARYKTSTDQARDMHACNSAHVAAIDLLNDEEADSACTDQKIDDVRQTLWQSVRGSLRNAIENIRNMTLRQQYISEISKNVLGFRVQLRDLEVSIIGKPPGRANNILNSALAPLAEQAVEARNATLAVTRSQLSTTSVAFSRWLKEEGVTYEKLLNRYATKTYGGLTFENLNATQRVDVYQKIIEASGRSNNAINNFSKAFGVMGVATIILTLGCVVWDVVESSNPSLAAVNNAIVLGAGFVGTGVGVELGAAVGSAGGPLGIFIGGVFGGIIAGFGTGLAANNIFDAMVAALSGKIPSDLTDHSLWGNPIIYTPLLPNRADLSTSLFPSKPL